MQPDPTITTVKATVQLDSGPVDVTLNFQEGRPAADATVSLPDGRVVEVDNVAVGVPHLKAALRLPIYEAVEKAQQGDSDDAPAAA
jgi:hypothetical protein